MTSNLCFLLVILFLSITLLLAQQPPSLDGHNSTTNDTHNIPTSPPLERQQITTPGSSSSTASLSQLVDEEDEINNYDYSTMDDIEDIPPGSTSPLKPSQQQPKLESSVPTEKEINSTNNSTKIVSPTSNLRTQSPSNDQNTTNKNRTGVSSTTLPPKQQVKVFETNQTESIREEISVSNVNRNSSEGCPEQCKCDVWEKRDGFIVNCSHQNLTTIPEIIPERTIYVNLRSNLIQNVTNTSFSKWNTKTIQKLNLAHNNLDFIDEDAFKYFNHIWEINFSSNELKNIQNIRLPIVHEMNLEGNQIDLNFTSGFDEISFKPNQKGDCDVIYRRNSKIVDENWKNLENVKQIMIKKVCPITVLRYNDTNNNYNYTDDVRNDTVTSPISSAKPATNVPTGPEILFYSSVLVLFIVMMLFLVSQSYNHKWLKCVGKKMSRKNTRDHVINVHPQCQRKQSMGIHRPIQRPI